MKHLQPMFIVPRGWSEANASRYMLVTWEAVHLHSEPFKDDATHELLTGLFRNHELEDEFLTLPDVQALPDVLDVHASIAPAHHQRLSRVKGLGVQPEHGAYQVRKAIRDKLQKGF